MLDGSTAGTVEMCFLSTSCSMVNENITRTMSDNTSKKSYKDECMIVGVNCTCHCLTSYASD